MINVKRLVKFFNKYISTLFIVGINCCIGISDSNLLLNMMSTKLLIVENYSKTSEWACRVQKRIFNKETARHPAHRLCNTEYYTLICFLDYVASHIFVQIRTWELLLAFLVNWMYSELNYVHEC